MGGERAKSYPQLYAPLHVKLMLEYMRTPFRFGAVVGGKDPSGQDPTTPTPA